jgi:hypothetical protein
MQTTASCFAQSNSHGVAARRGGLDPPARGAAACAWARQPGRVGGVRTCSGLGTTAGARAARRSGLARQGRDVDGRRLGASAWTRRPATRGPGA